MAIETVDIAAGATGLSGVIDLTKHRLAGIIMPGTWVAANLTFQGAADESDTFMNLYDDAGNEISVTAAASRCIALDATAMELTGAAYLKIRSGTAGTPVNQTATRTLRLVLREL